MNDHKPLAKNKHLIVVASKLEISKFLTTFTKLKSLSTGQFFFPNNQY